MEFAAAKFRNWKRFWRAAKTTLSGRALDDLKQHLDRRLLTADELAALAEFAAARTAPTDRTAETAMITSLPPDDSGVAGFSFRHASVYGAPIDIFSPVRDTASFIANATTLDAATGGAARLSPLTSFLAAATLRRYAYAVYVVGNSNHNIETVQLLQRTGHLKLCGRTTVYLHDPNCLNVVSQAVGLGPAPFADYIEQLYGRPLHVRRHHKLQLWEVREAALEACIIGVRALAEAGVDRFIVNSAAAHELVETDLGEGRHDVRTVFHPIFPQQAQKSPNQQSGTPLLVGSYGVPGPSKHTRLVIDAVAELRRRGIAARLLISGFDAQTFARREFSGNKPDWIEVDEPATEAQFQVQLARCDVAVQLRDKNLGESSGVVPSLLALGIPTIVSPLGAFLDYGAATARLDRLTPDALADLLASSHAWPTAEHMARYVSEHTLDKFEPMFRQALVD